MVRGVRVHTTFLRRGWGRGHGTFPMPGGGMPHFLCLGRGGLGGMGHVKNPQQIVGDQIWLHTGASEESIGAIGAEFRSASNGPCPARSSTYIYIIICILWCRVGTIVTIRSVLRKPPAGSPSCPALPGVAGTGEIFQDCGMDRGPSPGIFKNIKMI